MQATPTIMESVDRLTMARHRLETMRKTGSHQTISPRTLRLMEAIVRADEYLDEMEEITW